MCASISRHFAIRWGCRRPLTFLNKVHYTYPVIVTCKFVIFTGKDLCIGCSLFKVFLTRSGSDAPIITEHMYLLYWRIPPPPPWLGGLGITTHFACSEFSDKYEVNFFVPLPLLKMMIRVWTPHLLACFILVTCNAENEIS